MLLANVILKRSQLSPLNSYNPKGIGEFKGFKGSGASQMWLVPTLVLADYTCI